MPISSAYEQSGTGTKTSGFRVLSAQPIAGYFVNRANNTTDMTYLLDEGALGTEYVVASDGGPFNGDGSQVIIHATQDNTTVDFAPQGGTPVNVTLNAGETYYYAGGNTDLTGSFVSSDRAVAVFGGNSCTNVPDGFGACDNLLEQMIPTDKLSTSYIVGGSDPAAQSTNTARGDLVRVIATADNTAVDINGSNVATLNAGDFYEFDLNQNGGLGAEIDASNPVMVAQYLTGQAYVSGVLTDPAMSLVPGEDTWLDEYKLATPSGAQQFDNNYAAIVIETLDLASLLLDGVGVNTSGFTSIGGSAFSRGLVDLPLGLFTLTADSPFLVMLGGGSDFDSYLTYGGSTFAPGISPPQPPTPNPAPAPLALLAVGLAAIGAASRLSKARTRV